MEITDQPNGVRMYRCATWDEFITQVREPTSGADRLFRGHTMLHWKLQSVWERRIENSAIPPFTNRSDYDALLIGYLETFKERAVGLPGLRRERLQSNDDWWSLGRHLARYEIPKGFFGPALIDLDLMNINYATLFPDLEGIAKYSNVATIYNPTGK